MINGYAVVDEALIAGLLAGLIVARFVTHRVAGTHRPMSFQGAVFVAFAAYMTFESIRGLIFLADWRMVRYVAFFLLVGTLSFAAQRFAVPAPSLRALSLGVTGCLAAYLAAYVAHGIFAERVLGLSQFDLQGLAWSGSAYAVFPIVAALPFAFEIQQEADLWPHALGWAALLLVGTVAVFYDSRIATLATAVLALTEFGASAISRIFGRGPGNSTRLKGAVLGIGLFAAVIMASNAALFKSAVKPFETTAVSLGSVAAPSREPDHDADRRIQILGAFQTLRAKPIRLVIGSGFYSHRLLMRDAVNRLSRQAGLPVSQKKVFRTTALAALLVDTGLVGFLLLGMSFWLAARAAWSKGPSNLRILGCASLLLILGWLAVSNILDIVLLYLAIMPHGMFEIAARERESLLGSATSRLGYPSQTRRICP